MTGTAALGTGQATGAGRVSDRVQSDPSWYVVRNVSESERRVRECLRRAGYEVYVPLIRELRPVPKRHLSHAQRASAVPVMREALVPLFPRYVFVRFSLIDRRWHEVFATLGLLGVLCEDRMRVPRPFPEAIIRALQGSEVDGALPARMTVRELAFRIGEQVRIADGVLVGHNGIIEQLPDCQLGRLDESAKVKLLVALFGRQTIVALPLASIEKL